MSKEFIYISIPRTGTNSIHEAIGQAPGENHLSIKKIQRPGFSFAFVRNPFELLVSWYYYHKQYQKQEIYNKPFINWVLEGCPTHWEPNFIKERGLIHPLKQFDYLCNDEGKLVVDFVGRFENLQQDFNKVCEILDLPIVQLPTYNTSKHFDWQGYYTPRAKQKVEAQFEIDFKTFNF